MVNIEFYENLSDAKRDILSDSGKTIAEALHLANYDHFKIIVNGRFQDKEYVIQEGDSIIARRIPFALSTTALTVIAVSVAVVSAGVAVYAGVQAYKAKKEAQKLADEMSKVKNSVKDDIINRPNLRGATNTVATGKTQPYFIGKNLFTPYILNAGKRYKGFSTISGTDGEDQFYNVVLECGFNNQVLRKVYCDDITLKTFSDSETTPQEGEFHFDAGSAFASTDSFMEIAQDGKDFTNSIFNQKIVEQQINDQLKKRDSDDPSTLENKFYTLEKNSMGADVCISLQGLKKWDDEGTELECSRTINADYSIDYAHLVAIGDSNPEINATWNRFTFDDNGTSTNTFKRKTNKQLRFNAHVDFSYSEATRYDEPITIRVSSPDERPTSGTEYGECYINWVHSYCYDSVKTKKNRKFVPERIIGEKEAGMSTIAGFRIKSTSSNEDKLKSIQIITTGVARTWNNLSKTWSDTKVPTSNPASWMIEVMTSDKHAPSKVEFSEDDFDKESFGAWYQFCANKGLSVNYIITQGMTKSAIFDIILECGRASMYKNIYGKFAIAIDDAKENANGVLNEQNLISFSYEKKMTRKSDGLKITFIDANADYQESSFIVMYDESDPDTRDSDSVITSVTLNGVTDYTQAVHQAYYLMKSERLRPKKCTAVVGKEGIYYTPLSKFLVQHPTLKVGKGNGEIKNVILNETEDMITGLELYDSVNLENTQEYTMIVQAVGGFGNTDYCTPLQLEIRGGKGMTKEVELLHAVPITSRVIPHAHDIFSYGIGVQNVVDPMIITTIESSDDGYSLSLVDYDERIFNDSAFVPPYEPDFTTPQMAVASLPGIPNPTYEDLINAKKDAENYADLKIEQVTLDVSPRYIAQFNTSFIRKGNDGSYSPSVITGSGLAIKGDQASSPYVGNWLVFVNDETSPFQTYDETTNFELTISDILENYDNIDNIRVKFMSKNNQLMLDQEFIQVISGSASYSVVLENAFQTYEANEKKELTETTLKTRAHVFYGLKELTYNASDGWEYGVIDPIPGFDITVDNDSGEITIKALPGADMADSGRIEIPIFIHSQTNTGVTIGFDNDVSRIAEKVIIGFDGVTIGYLQPDENGFYYTYFNYQKLSKTALRLAQLDTKFEGYWKELTNDLVITVAEKNVLQRLIESLTAEYEAYKREYSLHRTFKAYEDAFNTLNRAVQDILKTVGNYPFDSASDKDRFNKKFDDYYTAKSNLNGEIASEATNFGGISDTEVISAKTPKPSDFFVWVGADRTNYGGIILRSGITYCWEKVKVGVTEEGRWVEDKNHSHIMSTMDEAMKWLANAETEDENIPAVSMAKCIIASQVVVKDLIAKFATIEKLVSEYSSNDQLKNPGQTIIHGGNIETGTISGDKIKFNEGFLDEISSGIYNINGGGVIKSENWNGKLLITKKGDPLVGESDLPGIYRGDYCVLLSDDGTQNIYYVFLNDASNETIKTNQDRIPIKLVEESLYSRYITYFFNDNGDIYERHSYPGSEPYSVFIGTAEIGDYGIIISTRYTYFGEELGWKESMHPTVPRRVPVSKATSSSVKILERGTKGLIELADGTAEFHNDVYADNLHISGNSTFEGTGTFNGTINATNSTFRGTVYANDGEFSGKVIANGNSEFHGSILIGNTTEDSSGYVNGTKITSGSVKTKDLQIHSISSDCFSAGYGGSAFSKCVSARSKYSTNALEIHNTLINVFGYQMNTGGAPSMASGYVSVYTVGSQGAVAYYRGSICSVGFDVWNAYTQVDFCDTSGRYNHLRIQNDGNCILQVDNSGSFGSCTFERMYIVVL